MRLLPLPSHLRCPVKPASDAPPVRGHAAADRIAALACRLDKPAIGRISAGTQEREREECGRNDPKEGSSGVGGRSTEAGTGLFRGPSSFEPTAGCILGGQVVRYRPAGAHTGNSGQDRCSVGWRILHK
jgi:hypothetical protein